MNSFSKLIQYVLPLFAFVVGAGAQTNSNSKVQAPTIRAGQFGGIIAPNGTGTVSAGLFVGGGAPFERVIGHPYSAEQVTEHVQILADGTHITQNTQRVMLYRDSEGRIRTERYMTPPVGAVLVSNPVFIEITDPVAGYRYLLDQSNHTARRIPWSSVHQMNPATANAFRADGSAVGTTAAQNNRAPGMNGAESSSPAASARPHPEMKDESLGTQAIEGVPAEGRRFTMVFPEGVIGNDRPITTVSDRWTSPDLKIVVLSKMSDPRNGDTTTKLTNLSQSEPDPSLFQVPSDYSINEDQH
jgi:hypothetical protein